MPRSKPGLDGGAMSPKKRLTEAPGAAVLGWREWVKLPALGVDAIKAKLDTGARTSVLHAFEIEDLERDGVEMVSFEIHPLQRSAKPLVRAEAEVIDRRVIRSSTGHEELRRVITTIIRIGDAEWPIELTLTRRDEMGFRLLLGRQALRGRFVVDPGGSYRAGRATPGLNGEGVPRQIDAED
jgi:hypothetical protein